MAFRPDDRIAGEYTLVHRIGAGRNGQVWLARHHRLDRDVALKFPFPHILEAVQDGSERFAREALTHARLDHRHIVPMYETGLHSDGGASLPFLVLRNLTGGPLEARAGKLSTDRLLRYAVDLCGALQHAHNKGVIHRDLTPRNLLLDEDDEVYIADFGIAKSLEAVIGEDLFRQATHATAAGTPGFQAPEQMRGTAIDHRADLFGLGATLTFLATREAPFDLVTPQRAPLLAKLDPPLRAIVDRLTQLRPEDRYPSAREARADFEAALRGGQSAPTTAPPLHSDLVGELRHIPAGSFIMGSPLDDPDRGDDEVPHRVTLTRPFYMMAAPVTQRQWEALMGPLQWYWPHPDHPADTVNYEDAEAFAAKVSQLEGRKYRLPTEAEWEWAARGGQPFRYAGSNDLETVAKPDHLRPLRGNWRSTYPVRQFLPNGYGLFDMSDHLYHWLADWYGPYPTSPSTDPVGPTTGKERVLRGGRGTRNARVSGREKDSAIRANDIGFRLVMVPGEALPAAPRAGPTTTPSSSFFARHPLLRTSGVALAHPAPWLGLGVIAMFWADPNLWGGLAFAYLPATLVVVGIGVYGATRAPAELNTLPVWSTTAANLRFLPVILCPAAWVVSVYGGMWGQMSTAALMLSQNLLPKSSRLALLGAANHAQGDHLHATATTRETRVTRCGLELTRLGSGHLSIRFDRSGFTVPEVVANRFAYELRPIHPSDRRVGVTIGQPSGEGEVEDFSFWEVVDFTRPGGPRGPITLREKSTSWLTPRALTLEYGALHELHEAITGLGYRGTSRYFP